MKKVSKLAMIFLIIMTALSFSNLLNIKVDGEVLKLSGLSVIVGVAAYFIIVALAKKNAVKENAFEEKEFDEKEFEKIGSNAETDKCLEIKTIFKDYKNVKAIIYTILVFVSVILCTVIANRFLPEFNEHLNSRISFVTSAELGKMIFIFAGTTLGEEIAWRAFFQKQTTKFIGFIPALILSSMLFALGHYSSGTITIVLYDLLFVFIDSCLYGLIFKETNNAWCSWIAHFLADIFALFFI